MMFHSGTGCDAQAGGVVGFHLFYLVQRTVYNYIVL
jgi:hypothetical protein